MTLKNRKNSKKVIKLIAKVKKKFTDLTPKEYMVVFDQWWIQVSVGSPEPRTSYLL